MADSNTGRFVWYELLTTDPKGAIAFYPGVTGWKAEKFPDQPDYTMWVGAQGPLGGVTRLPDQIQAMGVPSYWQANVVVDDIDAAIEKVTSLGGKIYVREEVPKIGTLAVIADPQGAVIALFTPLANMPAHDTGLPGEFSWHELYTTDHEAALRFYGALLGWQRMDEHDMGAMGKYVLWGRQGKQLGGMMTMPPGMTAPDGKPLPPSWMYYVTTADLDGALERAKAKGARVLNGPMEVPGGQRIVQLLDPQGGAFALVTAPKR